MASNKVKTEAETLEQYRVSLENVESQSEIAAIMAEFGYDSDTINEGKSIYAETITAYEHNKTEDDETSAAYKDFKDRKEQLADIYSLHRRKAKAIFRKDPLTLDKLSLLGSMPQAYIKWLEIVKKFYSVTSSDETIQSKLSRLKISPEDITNANNMVGTLESSRALYLQEKGESQDATKAKDAAFAKIDDWMSEFYAVAKIALEDKPQLLESLGKFVRS